ncbi:hypothetical protein CVT26_000331 [Gymnopilus dilepis]|uniref:Uncharacterized protein n=1 Tax=Gymnopilus dilepis TaxID=231916 RepID=A0A409VHG8_9AGAR|nr:hypothetical protein CVT26_000331 [Gymnopilus dilepis]
MLPNVARQRFFRLARIFDLGDVDTLKQEMDEASCIISGSAALYVLHPHSFIPNDLDFYCPESSAPDIQYALFQRGYTDHEDQTRESHYPPPTIIAVHRYRKRGVRRSINLVVTRSENPLTAVVEFHSTLVMNAITADGILCLYPMLTLSGLGVITVDTPAARRCFEKYRDRGFRFSNSFWSHNCGLSVYCRKTWRSIRGNHVLGIPFSDDDTVMTIVRKFAPFRWRLPPLPNVTTTSS